MIPERHPLRQLFHEVVAGCYHRHTGIDDPELTTYIGDLLTEFTATESLYSIRFATGMYPESTQLWRHSGESGFAEMVQTGKESYYIVSQFDLFEYRDEAPLFAQLSSEFERCMHGLKHVREELDRMGGMIQ